MSRFLILFILNAPLATYGLVKAIAYYTDGIYNRAQLFSRVLFWSMCLAGLAFAKPVSDLLYHLKLTNSPPLSLTDVLLTTACFISLTLIIRLYARLEEAEKRLTNLNEKLALRRL